MRVVVDTSAFIAVVYDPLDHKQIDVAVVVSIAAGV